MAMSVNIGGGDDQFNRYKMPSVIGKVEGRGNGIKTRIVNCHEVAKALHRPAGYVCKFFGCELGAQTKINDGDNVYIVNGAFNNSTLSTTLNQFIRMFVLCGNCNLPETDLKVKKNGDIKQICNACGAETMCDMTHKLCTYITNNPPDGRKQKTSGKGSKTDRRARKAAAAAAAHHDDEAGPSSSAHSNGKSRKSAKKTVELDSAGLDVLPMGNGVDFDAVADAAMEGSSNGGGAFSMMVRPGDDDFDGGQEGEDDGQEWSVDVSKEAQEARMREMGVNMAVLERGAKEEEAAAARKLRDYIDAGKKASKVISKAEKLFGDDRVVHGILAASVVDESIGSIPKSIENRAVATLAQFGTPMDKESQLEFLQFLEIYGEDASLHRVLPHILKTGFDGDILEEEHILHWYRKADGRKDVREAVKVIIDWLETAEEESDEEEESE